MKDRTTTIIAILIAALAFFQFLLVPALRRRSATKVVKSILTDWSENNMITPMTHWNNRKVYPSVVKLNSFKLRNRQILKKNDELIAKFTAELKFQQNDSLPMNSEWFFVLKKTSGRWMVIDFNLSRLHPSDMKQKAPVYDATADKRRLAVIQQNVQAERKKQLTESQPEEKIKAPLQAVQDVEPAQRSGYTGKRPGYRSIPAMVE